MGSETDFRVRDLGRSKLTLRRDLVFTPRSTDGESSYLIEDTLNSKFFRIGTPEYTFISLLDGSTSIADALRGALTALPDCSLTEQDAAAICKWLIDAQLAHTDESVSAGRLVEQANVENRRRGWGSFNPLYIRAPLFHPDRFFSTIAPWCEWCFSRWAMAVWAVVLAAGLYCVWSNAGRFVAASQGIFAPGNWLWLGLCWIVLKFVHEISHGVVCKKFGGTVREAGAIFLFFSPLAYVDVTSSWRFRSKWQRIATAAAGMYVELFFAAVAAFLWSRTGPGLLSHVLFNVVLMASLTTILFNANPLMRFDGYYMLSDLLQTPNLYSSGQQVLRYWARRYLLGVNATFPQRTVAKHAFISAYAVAALIWRAIVCACLTIAAATLFRGVGMVLALLVLALLIGRPTVRTIKYFWEAKPGERPKLLRISVLVVAVAALAYALVALVPWPGIHQAPAVVEFAPLEVVRADSSGFVGQVHVHGGQHVEKGQLLVVLVNPQLQAELEQLKLDIEISNARGRRHQQTHHLAAYQAELSKQNSLQLQLREKQRQLNNLTLRSPAAGKVIGRGLHQLLGSYISQGTEILSIGDGRRKQLRVSIAQQDIDIFSLQRGQRLSIRLPGVKTFQSRLDEVEPRASVQLYDVSLCAPLGGPLPVRSKTGDAASSSADQFELLAPRFNGIVTLSISQAETLSAGQRGTVGFRTSQRTVGVHLYHLVSRWVRDKVRARRDSV